MLSGCGPIFFIIIFKKIIYYDFICNSEKTINIIERIGSNYSVHIPIQTTINDDINNKLLNLFKISQEDFDKDYQKVSSFYKEQLKDYL